MAVDFDKIKKARNQLRLDNDPRLLNPSESTKINNIYTKEKALKPTQKVDPDRVGVEEFIPFISDALDFTKIGEDINYKNYGQAALGAGLLLVPNAIEKPVKAGLKVLKKPIKKYGTKIANKLEDRFPNMVDKFHTWNMKDNIKNTDMIEVVDNKKSRLLAKHPDYESDQNFISENGSWKVDPDVEIYDKFPLKVDREKKIKYPNIATPNETYDFINRWYSINIPKNYKHVVPESLDSYNRNVQFSFKSTIPKKKGIHVGDLEYDIPYKLSSGFYKQKPLSSFNLGTVIGHELDHYVSIPSSKESFELMRMFNLDKIPEYRRYFSTGNHTEIKARLGQIKDLFKLRGNENISKSQLAAGIKAYNDTQKYKLYDNDISTLFKSFDFSKLKELQNFMNVTSLKNGGKL
ncbi:hypothetical protein [Butyricimonas virosa]|uniref:hypothetical protein n=1 Tax=Butyricimonas virosa TaxID=544645 RepID=UPI000E4318EE|nr:hypothetical protein [Butyricimonas virosa]RGL84151.1 hypothetical protein DXC42_14640 [Butyricimonas virosa]